ncbi:keratin-associated protein 19-3-like [Chironomus tepperi]|uniref:keratin-associated protein 19-3-like n=1 Tax=Chironomus tepperi TaxID=113505 RepID=UPI00391F4F53
MLKEVFVVLCLMLAVVAAYPSEDVKNDQVVSIESNESVDSEDQDLSGAESRYGGFGLFSGKGFGHFGGHYGGFGFGRGFGLGHGGFGGHGWRHFG